MGAAVPDGDPDGGGVVKFLGWLRWLWDTRNCAHPEVRRFYGGERMMYGYACRCIPCGKALREIPAGAAER